MSTYLSLRAKRGLDVIHDVDVDVVENDTLLRHARTLPKNAAENHTSLRGGHLDSSLDTLEAMRSNGVRGWPLHKLQVAQGREVETQVLESVRRLVDEQDIYDHLLAETQGQKRSALTKLNVKAVNLDIRLGIDGIGETWTTR